MKPRDFDEIIQGYKDLQKFIEVLIYVLFGLAALYLIVQAARGLLF